MLKNVFDLVKDQLMIINVQQQAWTRVALFLPHKRGKLL